MFATSITQAEETVSPKGEGEGWPAYAKRLHDYIVQEQADPDLDPRWSDAILRSIPRFEKGREEELTRLTPTFSLGENSLFQDFLFKRVGADQDTYKDVRFDDFFDD